MTQEAPAVSAKPVRPPLKWHWRLARILALSYVGGLLFLYIAQAGFIFPGRATQGKPESQITVRSDAELITLTSASGQTIKALFGKALQPNGTPLANAAARPTVLFFYGNAMCLNQMRGQHSEFRRMGFNVLIPEYIGFGLSSGSASELACYETADTAYTHLQSRSDIDPKKIVAAGWSLGGAVAIDLASRKPVSGLATFSTFTRISAMGNVAFPFYPAPIVNLIVKHRFESVQKIPAISCPILIGHSRGDSIIPFFMADQLAAAAKGSVTRISIDKPDHNDFFGGGGTKVSGAITEFIENINVPAK
jgi:uncharacterized protein